jgi:hypothetical protein
MRSFDGEILFSVFYSIAIIMLRGKKIRIV